MLILKFETTNGVPYFFAGSSVGAILKETNNGLSFGGARLTGKYEKISLKKAQDLNLRYIDLARKSAQAGTLTVYLLGVPEHLKHPKKK